MKEEIFDELIRRYPALAEVRGSVEEFCKRLIAVFRAGGTLFVAGNGGSGADAEHICGELLKGFLLKRPLEARDRAALAAQGPEGALLAEKLQQGLRAVSLLSHPALATAFGNDVAPELVFAQQLWALGSPGDIFLAISTGGNACNLRYALAAARSRGIGTALLTGNRHGSCEKFADCVIAVPERETFKIQELHLPVYHAVCQAVEKEFFSC